MWRGVGTILRKDLAIELRTKEAFTASFVFAVLVLVIFNFALSLGGEEARRFGSGFLWIAFAFAGILALNKSFAVEKEESGIQGLMLAPVDRSAIYIAKLLANVIFLFVTEIIVLPLFAMFFNVGLLDRLPLLLLVLLLGTIGFSAVGTLFSAIAAHTRMREVLLPVLLLPVAVPLLIAAVETTTFALGSDDEVSFWFTLLAVFDIVFVVLGFLTFEFVLEE
jgi:heme exporter protein B